MTASFISLVFISLIGISFGQLTATCKNEQKTFRSCLTQVFQNVSSSSDTRNAAISNCLTTNNCQDPKKVKECKQKVIDQMVTPKLQQCAGFEIPDPIRNDEEDENARPVCPTKANEKAAIACIKQQQNSTVSQRKSNSKNIRTALSSLRQCKRTEDCRQQLADSRSAICNCSKSQVAGNADIEAALAACENGTAGTAGKSKKNASSTFEHTNRLTHRICYGSQRSKGRGHRRMNNGTVTSGRNGTVAGGRHMNRGNGTAVQHPIVTHHRNQTSTTNSTTVTKSSGASKK